MNARRTIIIAPLALGLLLPQTPADGLLQYYTVAPCRLVDTRDPPNPQGNGGPALAANTARHLPVYGQNARPCGLPSMTGQVKAAVLNFTIVEPTAAGHLVIYKYGLPSIPGTSNLNFNAGEPALANGALVELAADPNQQITVWTAMAGGATADLVVDITGYYQ